MGKSERFSLSAVDIGIPDRNVNLKQCAGVVTLRERRERTNQRSEVEEAGR